MSALEMSKERAHRRAAREAAAAQARDDRARQARRARRRELWALRTAPLRRTRRRAPTASALGRQRSRENGVLLAVLLAGNVLLWLVQPSWGWRISGVVLSILVWPLLAVVFFDRRASR